MIIINSHCSYLTGFIFTLVYNRVVFPRLSMVKNSTFLISNFFRDIFIKSNKIK